MPVYLKALLLEDRLTDAELLIYELKRSGYELDVQRVDNQRDYINALQSLPQIILADYSLPQFNAMDALRILNENELDIPFIVVTGTISEEVAVDCMKRGASDYLLKDRLSRLGQAVERALTQKRLRDEQKKAQEALRESEDRFRSMVQNLSDIITLHTESGVTAYESPSASHVLGYEPGFFIGKDALEFIHPDDQENTQIELKKLTEGEQSDHLFEFRFKHASGSWINLETIATNLLNHPGVNGLVFTSRDITDRKRIQADLLKANIELGEAYDATIEGWSRALDLRDKVTEGHTRRVTNMTLRLAQILNYSEADLVHMRRGALLHDIGKMGVPDQILQKPGPLTDEEWIEMRKHPVYAYNMLAPISYLRPALDIPYCHHERWDGGGYPRQLKEDKIPFSARIFSIVDVYDALSSDRPYRKKIEHGGVLEYIAQCSGENFEPALTKIFLEHIDEIDPPEMSNN